MPQMDIHLTGDGVWTDLQEKREQGKLIHYLDKIEVACLAGGMVSGKPSITFRFDLDDGRVLLAETSLSLFVAAARAFVGRYGEP